MDLLGLSLALSSALSVTLADAPPSLTTLARATNRPAECAGAGPRAGRRPSVWRLARLPNLGTYCAELGHADALVASDAKAALAAAQAADAALPGRASASVAIGRAQLALGDSRAATEAFDRAAALDGRALEEPKAMRDRARALVLVGRIADAAPLYRQLVPRAELLPASARTVVYLEAAHALMAHAASAPDPGLDLADAEAYLGEARTGEHEGFGGDVLLGLALVLQRAGQAEKAAAATAEAGRSHAALTDGGKAYVALASDALALDALALEAYGGAGSPASRAAWQKYLDAGPPAPWLEAARTHLGKKGADARPGDQGRAASPPRAAAPAAKSPPTQKPAPGAKTPPARGKR